MWAIVSFCNCLTINLHYSSCSSGRTSRIIISLFRTYNWRFLAYLISIDAVLVLCGAVLTSFVGVSGLLNRMTLDRILPNYFEAKQTWV
jgi:amino acid transporter